MKTLLFIDDDIGPLQYLIDICEMKYKVITADNLDTAFDALADYRIKIDLIITDWHLGDDVTAQKLFKELSKNLDENIKNLPIIVISSDDDNQKWVEKHGGLFFLKPAKPTVLLKKIEELIG